ncbi:MAG: hypothetical protein M1820_004892 [Bogoriella megaspora]|nr:MAG: hypothetical protein M1820_004892 [Bogoriella megaspora]
MSENNDFGVGIGPRGKKRTRSDTGEDLGLRPPPTISHEQSSTPGQEELFTAADYKNDGKKHLLLATTGSVATIKLPSMLQALSKHPKISTRVIISKSSLQFLQGQSNEQPHWGGLCDTPGVDAVYTNDDEVQRPWIRGSPILHIELRRWADIMVIAPLSANSLGKMVNGLCDDLVSEVLRAWDVDGTIDGPPQWGMSEVEFTMQQIREVEERKNKSPALGGDMMTSKYATPSVAPLKPTEPVKPIHKRRKIVLVAPAMNTAMWKHPLTKVHMKLLEGEWSTSSKGGWVEVLRPQEKALACGDTGDGAMMEWATIVRIIENRAEVYKKDGDQERDLKRVKT